MNRLKVFIEFIFTACYDVNEVQFELIALFHDEQLSQEIATYTYPYW